MGVTRPPALSLRSRLVLLVAIVVAGVIAIEGYLEVRTLERSVEDDILEGASATAQAVADDIELRESPQATEIHALLHEFLGATPAVRDIAVLTKEGDSISLVARTSTAGIEDLLPAARRVFERHERGWIGEKGEPMVAAPITGKGHIVGAVLVTVSLASIEQLSARGRQVTLWFAVPAIILLTVLVDLLARRLVHRPIAAISQTMHQAGAGQVGVRAPVERLDEMGTVARGLNEMLEQMERFQANLQGRIEEATSELSETNARLVESYQRVLTLREALARAEQLAALGQMAANVAHQIGTPLNLISGYVQLMIEETRGDARSLHRLQTIDAQIRKVTDAVRTMLDSARRPGLQREMVNLAALVEQVCEISRPALHAANVSVHVEARSPLPQIFADPVQLEMALLNLVSNSLDASPSGGRLDMVLSATDAGIRLKVADTGTGIPPDVLPRIFEPWMTTKPAGRGTGLGLTITREAIVSHGGTISVRSKPGRGTIFTIDLPVGSPPASD